MHRDIKPENLLLIEGHIKVADFGLALRMSEADPGSGTPRYMAPEVWGGKSNKHTDQYSLAAAYVELRLGRPLFPQTDLADLMAQHLKGKPDLGSLSDGEQKALHRAMAKAPEKRFPSCVEFMEAVERALARKTWRLSWPWS